MNNVHHFPPDLFNLLVDTIPLLFRSKKDVLIFFTGSGVDRALISDLINQVNYNPSSINKYEIVRTALTRLNEKGESCLRERRELLKRVVEFESFDSCWENNRIKAKGYVAEIQRIVGIKDSFTRMKIEKEKEEKERRKAYLQEIEKKKKFKATVESIRLELSHLFHVTNPQKRGKSLESLLNRLFKAYNILVREDFTLTGNENEGIVEQVDGVIEIDNNLYLVEMKWWKEPVGVPEVSQHLVRLFSRSQSRAIFISASGYTTPAIHTCREALSQKVIVLCHLHEIINVLENEGDLITLLREKINASIIDKNPYLTNTQN